ncbi:AmmeMemoRadiSam system protein B [Candidatus Nitrosotalea okcheonensis]|uniref:MEMO1 family protein NCS_30279 n=1 Tax=Candidatus Nitrosotalea okcheonensis TaxID=1903276 RepID=A0A2H1FI43_9ARCH|nr:AmmeMemoRadiSam system protein B [Candidatus Nitrosotalea okcheonensis]SMH72439.1 MEMO1 family protein Nmar_0215 [Candidatus Nitrosotalea okcheonensis]
MQVRTPAVAGMFYPKTSQELKSSIKNCFLHKYGPGILPPSTHDKKIIGAICPHAGYEYSGPIAANSYYAISSHRPELVIIIGPNHWAIGRDVATMKEGIWRTPIGDIEVDTDSAIKIGKISKLIEFDFFSHTRDHCLEVQIPMLQEIFSHKFKILPIILIDQSRHAAIKIGESVAMISKIKNTIIIGSSDFTHYEPNDFAHDQDKSLIDTIVNLDVDAFYEVLQEKKISACGYGAIASTMIACKKLGATKGTLIKYATSGDISGNNKDSVVGYASIVFS